MQPIFIWSNGRVRRTFYGITNLRDVLSHLSTFLSPGKSSEQRQAQLNTAEEHLRRSIIEPYETALNELTAQFAELYERYRQAVLPGQKPIRWAEWSAQFRQRGS